MPTSAPPPTSVPSPTADAWLTGHVRALCRYLRMLGASPTLAEDLAQEAFVVAWRRGKQQLEPAALAAFLRRTARNLWLHARRADRRGEAAIAAAAERLWRRDCSDDGGSAWIDATRACIARLRGRARRAIELGYVDGVGREQMAQALGMQANGVKTLLQRTRRWLQQCIERNLP